MLKNPQSRREFLSTSGSLLGGGWLSSHLPLVMMAAQTACIRRDMEVPSPFTNLSLEDALYLDAITEQIFPTDDTPGAREIGVVYFIDEALGSFYSDYRPAINEGLNDIRSRLTGNNQFFELSFDAQKALLQSIEETPFFQLMIWLTQVGVFAMPSYGGNIKSAGWQLIGFEDRHAWTAPFGYYDAGYKDGESDDGD